MKELSIEEKAKAYDEALEKAKYWHKEGYGRGCQEVVEDIFPELKESEDERIRKDIIVLVKDWWDRVNKDNISTKEQMLAWLEKQGEHANFRNNIQIGDKVTRNEDGVLINLSQLNRVAKKDEKRGEQKPVIIPKFRVGDVIQLKAERLAPNEDTKIENTRRKITGITNYYYTTDTCAIICFEQQDCFELVEQKPTDLPNGEDYGIDGLYAAVDILQKTLGKVEGYQTDDGILEHECAISAVKDLSKQKPAWSEEDSVMINKLCAVVNLYYNRCGDDLDKQSCIAWLKSLRPQSTWKPSIAQLNALSIVSKGNAPDDIEAIVSLYNDLKKLREE